MTPPTPLTDAQLQRYARQLVLPQVAERGQARLRDAKVAVVGAGGLGCPALAYLAGAGVGVLTVIDDDVVAVENLHRQVLHGTDDIGDAKVDSAARALARLNPEVEVRPVRERLTPHNATNILAGHDVILDGADNFPTRYTVADAATELRIPVVWAAVLGFDAQVSTFVPDGPGLRDLFPRPPRPEDVPSCAEAGVLGPVPGQAGAVMATEALALLLGIGEPLIGRVLVLDLWGHRTREVPLRRHTGPSVLPEATPAPAAAVPGVSADRLRELLSEDRDLAVIDVREPHEQVFGVIEAARCVPVGQVLTWQHGDLPQAPVVLVCQQGPRAERAARHLIGLGHPDVSTLTGGIVAWQADQVTSVDTGVEGDR